jgi:hypothetical protein
MRTTALALAVFLAGCAADYVTHQDAGNGVTRIRFDMSKDEPLSGGSIFSAESSFNVTIYDICPHGHERLRAWRTGDSFTNYVYFWDVRCLGSEPLSKQPRPGSPS